MNNPQTWKTVGIDCRVGEEWAEEGKGEKIKTIVIE